MRHIKTFSSEDRVSILAKLVLDTSPTELDLRNGITNFVFDKCKHLIPEKLISLIQTKANYDEFIVDIKEHLELNTMLLQQLDNNQKNITSNYNLLKEMLQKLNELCEKNNFLKFSGRVQYYKEEKLEKKIAKDFDLSIVEEANTTFNPKNKKPTIPQVKVPCFAAPFIFFTTFNHDIHDSFKHSKVEYPEFFMGRAYLYTQFLELYKERKDVSLYLFEREYHLHLIESILEGLDNISDFHKVNALRVLSLASLLPNIRGRSQYISVLCDAVFEMKYDYDENGSGYGSSLHTIYETKESRETIWLQRTTNILLEMAMLVFPIMELYHYHLCSLYNQNPDPQQTHYKGYMNSKKHNKDSFESVLRCIHLIQRTNEKNHINNLIRDKEKVLCSDDDLDFIVSDPIKNFLRNVVSDANATFFKEFNILN